MRHFLHRLALRLGVGTVEDLRERMSADELVDWLEFDAHEREVRQGADLLETVTHELRDARSL